MENVVSLNDILKSKVYIKENSGVNFGSPRQYIEPFLEKMKDSGATYRVAVAERTANKEEEGEINEAYGRVLIEAKLPNEFCVNEHDSVIGMLYALDTQKPSMKIYSGENAWACTNLSIFGSRYIHSVELVQGVNSVYDKTMEYMEGLTQQLSRFRTIYTKMNEKIYEGEEINTIVGYLLRESYKNKSIGTTPIISAMQSMEDNKSKYAIRENKISQWLTYNAITQYVTDKCSISEKASKSVSISNLFVNE